MKAKLQLPVLLLSLCGLGSLTLIAIAILTHYPGLIILEGKLGAVSGQATIDGRSSDRSALPSSK